MGLFFGASLPLPGGAVYATNRPEGRFGVLDAVAMRRKQTGLPELRSGGGWLRLESWSVLSGRTAKCVLPFQSGKGRTGLLVLKVPGTFMYVADD